MNEKISNDLSISDASSREGSLDVDSEPPEPGFRILVANEQSSLAIENARLVNAVRTVLAESNYFSGMISIAVVDDPRIHELNRQYLQHDYPTDVLSFALVDEPPHLEGELVVSSDTAMRNAAELGWMASDELLLYAIHGALHLVGHRDKSPADNAAMCREELAHLQKLGVSLPADRSRWTEAHLPTDYSGENFAK